MVKDVLIPLSSALKTEKFQTWSIFFPFVNLRAHDPGKSLSPTLTKKRKAKNLVEGYSSTQLYHSIPIQDVTSNGIPVTRTS